MKVKPAIPGQVIRDPASKLPLPAEGAEVPESSQYWQRRLFFRDVVRVDESPMPTGLEPVAPLTTRGKEK